MESADIGAGYNESLAERLASGVLPVSYALLCATDIASALRDLHQKGLAHGDVNPMSIRLRESGARLQPRGSRSRSADARSDVAAFGAVLYQMVTGRKPPSDVPFAVFTPVTSVIDMADVRSDAIRLAEKCLGGSPDMKQVLIELRILGILTRRLGAVPRRLQVVAKPATAAPEPHRLQVVDKPATVAPEPQRLQVVDKPATVAPEPERPQVADMPVAVAPDPRIPQAADMLCAGAPDAALEPPVASTVVCPRCSGHASFASPRSKFDRLLNKISHMRQCELCGYRFIVIRFLRLKS